MPSQLTLQDIASGSQITALDASKLSGTLPAISGANLTNLPSIFPFFKSDGTSDTISITNGTFPFFKADGSSDTIGVS